MAQKRTLTDGITVFTARSYQEELEDISLAKNTIIHLPTGSGKTFIAIRLIKRFREALRKPWGAGGKRTFFLVNTVPLVNQQKMQIEKLCPVTVGAYSGEDGVDYWDKAKWDTELTKNQVIVMTSQILADMLTHSYIKIEDLNLIIFDECHHAVENHPMRLVMKHFEMCPVDKQPRVLGLTATLLNSNVSKMKVDVALRELEKTFHATIATVNELGEVLSYSTNPHELVQFYNSARPTPDSQKAVQLLTKLQELIMSYKLPLPTNHDVKLNKFQHDITTDPNKIVKNVKNMVVSMVTLLDELGVYGGALAILAYIILLERLKRKASTKQEEKLYKFTITHSVEARMILLDSMKADKGYKKIVKHSSEKVIMLLNVLKEYNPDLVNKSVGVLMKVNRSRQPLSAIIFTQQRFTAKVLYNLLKDVKEANPEEFDFLNHDFIVGFNVNPFKSTREQYYTKKASQAALLKFANRELNCLISTSVIEEGVDIPQCLLVLKFDQPLEYRSYIQSKGRARSSESSYVIMINMENRAKFMKQYEVFQQTERIIQRILIGNSDDRDAPTMDEIQEGLYDEDEIPPYITEHGGRLSAISAISLLGRYCSLLPHDQFTTITPMWVLETDKEKQLQLISVIMPIACPIKEQIVGLPMANTKSAKRSAALNACVRLHQAGELDPVTLLPKPYAVVNFDSEEVKKCFPNWPWEGEVEIEGVPKTGGKKRVRKHKIEFPTCLKGNSSNKHFFLHIIKLKTNFPMPKESRERTLYDFFQRSESFGILTHSKLPKICSFPMFVKIGEINTSLDVNYAVITLNDSLFEIVKQFHLLIFDQVLGVAKKFLMFDGTENCMYVVPVKNNKGFDIDWNTMIEHKTIEPVVVPSYAERQSLRVTQEGYKDCVVTPWYRPTLLPEKYIVSNVLEYMTPMSRFADQKYKTFNDYYGSKYNLEVVGPKDQPLLEVKNITTGMNCLLPRSSTRGKAFTEKQHKQISEAQGDRSKIFDEIFIAEFCIKFEFPGVLWYKAMMLPSILHRIYMLLVAQELLMVIAKDTKYGNPILDKTEEWSPIKVDEKILIQSLLAQVQDRTPTTKLDRINNPIEEEEPAWPNVSMADSFYQLQKKKLEEEYPWTEKMEPIDIERNISTVSVMDIECYDKFVSAPMVVSEPAPRAAVSSAAAIRAPPLKNNDRINLLHLKPTGRGPEQKDVLAALTSIKSHDTFHMERAETLGDSFLKFAATLYLYHKFPRLNEGQLTNIKCRLISNRNLYYAAEKKNLAGRMKVEPLIPRKDFLVPGFFAPKEVQDYIEDKEIRPTFLISMQLPLEEALSGELSAATWQQVQQHQLKYLGAAEPEPEGGAQNAMQCYVKKIAVSDKSVADCVEALIGTYLFSGGILGAVKFVEWMKILPPEDKFEAVLRKPQRVTSLLSENKASLQDINFLLNNCRTDVEEILGYKFKDPSLMLEALSHASYIRNRVTRSYERLEFLGDAILDFLITSYIYENCTNINPGEMTDLRSALVNNVTFASYVVKLGLHKFICSKLNPNLDKAVVQFVEHQMLRKHEIVEEVLYLIDEEDCQVAQYIEVPKMLSDVFESLAGAIYLDSGGDLQAVWSVYYRIMNKEIQAFADNVPKQPVRLLYEDVHACPFFQAPRPLESDESKMTVQVTFTKNDRLCRAHGVGSNKAQAKRAAAKMALKVLAL